MLHYKGDAFLYCGPCSKQEFQMSNLVALIGGVVILALGALILIYKWSMPTSGALSCR